MPPIPQPRTREPRTYLTRFFPLAAARRVLQRLTTFVWAVLALPKAIGWAAANRSLLRNHSTVMIFWHWSFGHTALGLDFTARLFHPRKILVIYIPHARSNCFVPECFPGVEMVTYAPNAKTSHSLGKAAESSLRFVLTLSSAFTRSFNLIEFRTVYRTLSLASAPLLMGDEERNVLVSAGTDATGYSRLLRERVGLSPRLPSSRVEACQAAISASMPEFFGRPFVTLLLREKGRDGDFTTASRCVGPQERYRSIVTYLHSAGYNVVGRGETNHAVFQNLPGYYDLDGVNIDSELLDVFLLSRCALFIGQQSGPHVLPNACGIPCVIADAWPHRLGTFSADDIMVFKQIKIASDAQPLDLTELYLKHSDLAYGYHYRLKTAEVLPSPEAEILWAVSQAVSVLKQESSVSAEDEALFTAFRQLPSEGMTIRYQGNTPSVQALRAIRHRLITEN